MGKNEITLGNASKPWGIKKDSVDLIVTSPPYWQHRDNGPNTTTIFDEKDTCNHKWMAISKKNGEYCDKCGAWKGQLGQESHPQDYIKHLADIFTNHGSVSLKPTGQLWVNLGDCYSKDGNEGWVQRKQKLLIPERFAIEMQNRGWVLRNDIIWAKSVMFSDKTSKGGGMPSSVHDRFNSSHEYFYFFIKPSSCRKKYFINEKAKTVSWSKPKKVKDLTIKEYFSSIDDVRIKPTWVNSEGQRTDLYGRLMGSRPNAGGSPKQHAAGQPHLYMTNHPLGKNPGSVWQFHTEPFEGEHNSPYPPKLIQWIIKFGSPKRVCPQCGLPEEEFYSREEKIIHTARCSCNTKLSPSLVFDPFMGAGSTAIAALRENRLFGGLELNPTHLQISKKRILAEFPECFTNKLIE